LGCGPEHALPGWWNVDIRSFPGVDQVLDATEAWPFEELEYIYAEHFLEHLSLEGAFGMLNEAWRCSRSGATIRISTPSLEWVLASHFDPDEKRIERRIENTFMINRAFHGWGHQFLYSRELLRDILGRTGWEQIRFCNYGESANPDLSSLERHGNLKVHEGVPSVWIVEADRAPDRSEEAVDEYRSLLDEAYVKYVRGGH
jgi:predicted SAM-dependent methyltransferase